MNILPGKYLEAEYTFNLRGACAGAPLMGSCRQYNTRIQLKKAMISVSTQKSQNILKTDQFLAATPVMSTPLKQHDQKEELFY